MTSYIIIDDEHIAHDIIKGYGDLLPYLSFQQSCYDAIEALAYLKDHPVDLIFLDLNLPKLKGFDFLRTLSYRPQVIVTTAYSEHALEGYELNIVDYLLKPFGFDRFIKAVQKCLETNTPTSSPAAIASQPTDLTVFLRSDKKHYQVKIADILYLEAAGNYTKVICTDTTITTRNKVSSLLEMLPTQDFVRVHKSFAVAKQHITSIEGNRIFMGTAEVPVGKMYRLNILELLG